MSLLSRIESLFQAIFEGGPRRIFRPQLQPIEISHALERIMVGQKVVGPSSVAVPNRYRALLNPSDYQRLDALRGTVEHDSAVYLERRAAEQALHPISAIQVELVSDGNVPRSQVQADAAFEEQASNRSVLDHTRQMDPLPVVAPLATLLLVSEDGRELRVGQRSVKVGRAQDNDFVIRDARVSRHHAVIEPDPKGWVVRDLQSTNGTFVEGRRVEAASIARATEISLGGCRLIPRDG